jgi:hypothetical protein
MEAEHTQDMCANIPFKCGGGTRTAAQEWDYVVNQPAVATTDGRDQGQEGQLLKHFIDFNGEDCVQVLALVDTDAGRGVLTSVLKTEAEHGALLDDESYTVRLPDGQQKQCLGKALKVVESDGKSAQYWLGLHGKTGKLKLKPVTCTRNGTSNVQRGLLQDMGVAFHNGKFADGLELDADSEYEIRVSDGTTEKCKGADLRYCGDEFEQACLYELQLHTLDGRGTGGAVTVQGAYLVWHDSVFRAGLTEEEVIGLRLYTGTHTHTHTHTHTGTHTQDIYTHTHSATYILKHTPTKEHIHTTTHTHTHTHTHDYTHTPSHPDAQTHYYYY